MFGISSLKFGEMKESVLLRTLSNIDDKKWVH